MGQWFVIKAKNRMGIFGTAWTTLNGPGMTAVVDVRYFPWWGEGGSVRELEYPPLPRFDHL